MSKTAYDRLYHIFHLRREFLSDLRQHIPESQPEVPVDISTKKGQQHCRDLALRGVEEMFEALQHLKNWKTHKLTEDPEFDREEFLEEIVDAFNYFFALLIAVDCDEDEFFEAFLKKDKIIHDRLKNKY
jgi:hypothetical protein